MPTQQSGDNNAYLELKEKFDKFNLQRRGSASTSAKRSETFFKTLKIAPAFVDHVSGDVPRIKALQDRRMMREELQKEIIKREMEIIEKRSRKSQIFFEKIAVLSTLKMIVDPEKRKTSNIPMSLMLYEKFPVNDVSKISFLRHGIEAPKVFLKPYYYIENPEDECFLTNLDIDPAFRKIRKTFSNFLIWRVENQQLIPIPREQYGIFFDEDCYLIYAASQNGHQSGMQSITREIRGRPEYHIHFWLGNSTNQEKAGIAAYKSVELDSFLNCISTQHREVQCNESSRFHSYFDTGFRILTGTLEPDNMRYQKNFECRLYKVKGLIAPVLIEMSEIDWSVFSSTNVFLLHTQKILFVWIGRASSTTDRLFAINAAVELCSTSNTGETVFVDDGYEKTLFDQERIIFEKYLPLDMRIVKSAEEEAEPEDNTQRMQIRLYHCCDNKTKYRITELKTGELKQTDLKHDEVYILDHLLTGVWAWVGKSSTEKQHTEAIRNARGFVKKKNYNSTTPVARVVDGFEPVEFKMLFRGWVDKSDDLFSIVEKRKVPVIKVTKFDAITMYERQLLAAKSQLVDDGTGHLRVWRVKRFETFEIPKERFGTFYTGDCYIALYTYRLIEDRFIIYYWMGASCIADEQDATMLKIREINTSIANEKAIIGRVMQGHEPAHFLQLFKGRLRIFQGKGTDCDVTGKNMKTPKAYLLQVEGTSTYNTKAIQVPVKASSLNSNFCFILKKNNIYFVWCGAYSTGDNREMAKLFAGIDFNLILEGSEPADFWTYLGGKKEYNTLKIHENFGRVSRPARLFRCFFKSHSFKADEILFFAQKDLRPEEIMLLDAQESIYLWVGDYSTKEEQKYSMEIAKEFLRTDTCGRDTKTPIIRVRQGYEPPTFTGFFDIWDDLYWKNYKTYEELRLEIAKDSTHYIFKRPSSEHYEFDNYNKYCVSILKGSIDSLPTAVDPKNKELHLTYDDFVSLFNMEYKDFEKLPLWKRQELKKNVGLF